MGYMERYRAVLDDPLITKQERDELVSIKGDEKQIEERFYADIDFGTAGLRGIIRAGTTGMNIYNVKRATQGLAEYLAENGVRQKGVVIGYDSRHMSAEFARVAALVLCGNGIKAYLFDSLRPVPELSFSVRYLGCAAGIEITASHNPKEYNGYKVYADYGGQLAPGPSGAVKANMGRITSLSQVKYMDEDEALRRGLLKIIGKEEEDAYISSIKTLMLNPQEIKKHADMPIVYTPLNGTGNIPVRRVLAEAGFKNVTVVPEQEKPDGDFPTVKTPNPEDEAALALSYALAQKTGAKLIIATDPDADRVCAAVYDGTRMRRLTGNQTASLLLEYILTCRKKRGDLPDDALVVRSVVSTTLADAIARSHGLPMREVLTGFRYISELIAQAEKDGQEFIFGFEESYGCLAGDFSRDKDAVLACMLVCEAAAYYASRGLSLFDALEELYKKHGYYAEDIINIPFPGVDGQKQMSGFMAALRENPPEELAGRGVTALRDYLSGIRKSADGALENMELPSSDILYFELKDGWACFRPSGTEPKLKAYIAVRAKTRAECEQSMAALKGAVGKLL